MLVAISCIYVYADAIETQSEIITCTSSTVTRIRVRACEIKRGNNMWIKRMVDAYYDNDSNRLYVGEYSYSVSENNLYGKVSDKRGDYHYVAGNFYFDM